MRDPSAAALGGGVFQRTLDSRLRAGFEQRGLARNRLIRQLLGSPAIVETLQGSEREVALEGYEAGLKALWFMMAVIALAMFFVQAGTRWDGNGKSQSKKRNDKKRVSVPEREALVSNSNAGGIEGEEASDSGAG